MAVSYNKLWKLMIDEQMNKTQLREKSKVSTNAIAKMGRNDPVAVETLEKVCAALHCNIGDVIDYIPDNKNKSE